MNKKKTSKPRFKINVDNIHVGPFKKVTYYQADIKGPDHWMQTFRDIGRKVITEDQYLNIGFVHVIENAVNNKFELTSVLNSKSKSKKK